MPSGTSPLCHKMFINVSSRCDFYHSSLYAAVIIWVKKKKGKEVPVMADARILNKQKTEQPLQPHAGEQEQLKGTLVSVFILGGIILLSWFGIFLLYAIRS